MDDHMKKRDQYTFFYFSLVELVIVLTTLISIASLIVPAVYNSSQHAKSLMCSGNLKQLADWVNVYTQENENALPSYETGWGLENY